VKALSLTQPWATLIAVSAKQYETRSWGTQYRGPLAIHASKGFPRYAIQACLTQPFSRVLYEAGIRYPAQLPLGCIVAVCELESCVRTEFASRIISDQEKAFGDYTPGRWAWVLKHVRKLDTPVPARGSLGLWDWDPVTQECG